MKKKLISTLFISAITTLIIQGCQDVVLPINPTPAHSSLMAKPDTIQDLENSSSLVSVEAQDANGVQVSYESYEFSVTGGGYHEGPTPNSVIVFPIGCCSKDSIRIECICIDSKGTKTVITKFVHIQKKAIVTERTIA